MQIRSFLEYEDKANALGFVDAPQLKKEAERWHKFQADIERTYLRPDKSEMKWQ